MPTLTIIVLAKNESRNLPGCLASAAGADEILVVDDFSDDDSVAIAESFGAKVVQRALGRDWSGQRNYAQSEAQSDWVLHLDADERLSPDLMAEIKKHITQETPQAAAILRQTEAFGRRYKGGVLKPDWVLRLFPKNAAVWEGQVHESPRTRLPLVRLKNTMRHLTYPDLETYIAKLNRYSTLWAEEAHRREKKSRWLDLGLRPFWAFFKAYFLNLGVLEGPAGRALCRYHYIYTLSKYFKLKLLNEGSWKTDSAL